MNSRIPERRASFDQSGRESMRRALAYLFIFLLIATVVAEGYAVSVLREKLEMQTEELSRISMQLQSLKDERDVLKEEFSSFKIPIGEKRNGNPPER